MTKATQSVIQQHDLGKSSASNPIDLFIEILNNRLKDDPAARRSGQERTRGFVVIVRGERSLRDLQSACFQQTWNDCLAARYRLQPGAIFGTLIGAFMSDLKTVIRGGHNLHGALMPDPIDSNSRWKDARYSSLGELLDRWPDDRHGSLVEGDLLEMFIKDLHDEKLLSKGRRLVLFAEVRPSAEDHPEWDQAMSALFFRLPERAGLVLSGAPDAFRLPEDDPHFLMLDLPEGGESDQGGKDIYRYRQAPFHTDRAAREDRLGVKDYAEAMARFVLHPQTQPPLVIGIHGPWGKGKSSFMELIEIALVKHAKVAHGDRPQKLVDLSAELAKIEDQIKHAKPENVEALQAQLDQKASESVRVWDEMKRIARPRVISIRFNAWQYQDATQIWAGLASAISEGLERALPWPSRLFMRVEYAWHNRLREFVLSIILPVLVVGSVAVWLLRLGSDQILALMHSAYAAKGLPEIGELLRLVLPAGSLLFLLWFIAWRILKVVQPVSERVLSYMQLPSYREQRGYQHRVMEDLQFAHRALKRHYPRCKAIVYIDDLDRCSDDKIMEILQAINLILGSSEFFVFLGMDTEMIYRAIQDHYSGSPPKDFPENYLRKIIQLSFHLPETLPDKRFELVSTLFSADARAELQRKTKDPDGKRPTITDTQPPVAGFGSYDLGHVLEVVPQKMHEVEDTADELAAFQTYREFLQDNPREIKRLVNIHRLIKIILQRPTTEWPGEKQRRLVRWLIFCANWPDLIDDVLAQVQLSPASPNVLKDLTDRLDPSRVAAYQRLVDFGMAKDDVLSAEDIDGDFRLSAHVSQMVRESAAPLKAARAQATVGEAGRPGSTPLRKSAKRKPAPRTSARKT